MFFPTFDGVFMSHSRARRSVFAVPGSSEKMIGKSLEFQVDQIFLDLEDAVAPEAKSTARELIHSAGQKKFAAPTVSVRINAIESAWFDDDLSMLESGVGRWIDSIILPKVRTADDVEEVSLLLSDIERKVGRESGSIAIDAQIESAIGLVNCEAIARAARVSSLNFGPADFMADLGMTAEEVTSNEYALMKILVAARAAGIAAIDGPTLEVRDISKFRNSAQLAATMGCDGKWVLHPDQIDACHEIFTPSQDRFDEASCLLEAYEYFTSTAGGAKGAAIYKGAMIDEASRKMALAVFSRGSAAGMKPTKRFEP
jgi:citrate lyase subunit beta/citryl-CoA lyase